MGLLERWARPFAGWGAWLAKLTNGIYKSLGYPGRLLQDLLNGSFLGHSTDGLLTDAEVGAVTALFVTSDGVAQRLSVSIGGAVCAGDGNFAQLFRVADRRLYAAKHAGRNRVELGGSVDDADVAAMVAAIS